MASKPVTPWPAMPVFENTTGGDGWSLRRPACIAQQSPNRLDNLLPVARRCEHAWQAGSMTTHSPQVCNASKEAADLVGSATRALVLEPSLPAINNGEWFADDPAVPDSEAAILPTGITWGSTTSWSAWLVNNPARHGAPEEPHIDITRQLATKGPSKLGHSGRVSNKKDKLRTGGHLPEHKASGRIAQVRELEEAQAAVSPVTFPHLILTADYREAAAAVRETSGGVPFMTTS
ncbi:MAG: hypothetical protein ACI88C_001945 [Acidimicrobiales bacterium]|jgi:hypothetical protein